MKKKISLMTAMCMPYALFAQEALDNEFTKKIFDVGAIIIPLFVVVLLMIRLAWTGIQYAMKPEDQRNQSDSKALASSVTQAVIGSILALSAAGIVRWLYPYLAN